MARNVKVFELEAGSVGRHIFGPMSRTLSSAAQTRIAKELREGYRITLNHLIEDAVLPLSRSRNAYNTMRRGGVRVAGTSFASLRAHIIGPSYILAHERGTTIEPVNAEYLAIPLPPALRTDGTPKLPRPRMWKPLVNSFSWKSSKTGEIYIVYKNADGGFVFLYVLKDEITLTKHKGFLSKAWTKREGELIEYYWRAMLGEMGEVNIPGVGRVRLRRK